MAVYSELATPTATSARLQELGLATKKSLGQHFLVDNRIVGRIMELAGVQSSDVVLEIGPGIGTLTLALQQHAHRVVAIEYDEALIEPLREIVDPAIVTVIHADAAKWLKSLDCAAEKNDDAANAEECITPSASNNVAPHASAVSKLVANLPYEVAATVVLRSFELLPNLRSATVMVQAEVADRMNAPLGAKDYSAYTVKLALLAQVCDRFAVARTSFMPPPRVDSTVVRLERTQPTPTPESYRRISQVIDTAFGMRRKTLRNNLRTRYPDEVIDTALAMTGIDAKVRAEMLCVAQFTALTDALAGAQTDKRSTRRTDQSSDAITNAHDDVTAEVETRVHERGDIR